mmetsp:Transcript_97437/g.291038  ORF Transcript_97437/g.291038 Transcript_97437/m.291038 type:complete len:248 (-) Transcript_97437:52-795(-)
MGACVAGGTHGRTRAPHARGPLSGAQTGGGPELPHRPHGPTGPHRTTRDGQQQPGPLGRLPWLDPCARCAQPAGAHGCRHPRMLPVFRAGGLARNGDENLLRARDERNSGLQGSGRSRGPPRAPGYVSDVPIRPRTGRGAGGRAAIAGSAVPAGWATGCPVDVPATGASGRAGPANRVCARLTGVAQRRLGGAHVGSVQAVRILSHRRLHERVGLPVLPPVRARGAEAPQAREARGPTRGAQGPRGG